MDSRGGSKRRRPCGWLALSLVVLIVLVALVLGCRRGGGSATPGTTRVKLQLNWLPEPEFGGFYAARESGAYQRQGLDVEIVGGGPSSPVVQLVASGQAEFGVVAAEDVIVARARGADVVAVFATFQTSPQCIMVHASRGLASLDDLRSGTLAVEPGAAFVAFLKKRHGFVGVTVVPYDGGVAKFSTDPQYAQQCYVTSEPIAARRMGSEPKVFLAADSGFNPYAGVVITQGRMLRERMKAVRAFVAATADGWRAYLADPSKTNATMGKLNPAMDAETFSAAAAAQRPLIDGLSPGGGPGAPLGTMTGARFRTLGEQLKELSIVSSAPPPEECFTAAALPSP